ncbi:MAG: arsenate reductase (glutaredoxin) [Chlorobi bacterium]|nr:arsenate reductase (glutaredoxin) [Chlorobiota bacterium]
MKIYHNPRCKKSRAGLQYLQEKNVEHEVVLYLKDKPFTEETFKAILTKLGKKPLEMLRTQEKEYKANYKGKEFSDDEWIKIMVENPKFINRPIIETDEKAVWGDPVTNIDEIL